MVDTGVIVSGYLGEPVKCCYEVFGLAAEVFSPKDFIAAAKASPAISSLQEAISDARADK